ncbi:MAG: hypothetical protein WCB68_14010 [Pyrinomonadaceae bacterium]
MAEIFANFEINRAPRWQPLARLVGASFAFHLVALACMVYVPAVRDAVHIAFIFSGVNYVDKDYVKTRITDRAQIIELPHEKFRYPDGYFASENPQEIVDPSLQAQVMQQWNPAPMPVYKAPKIRPPKPEVSPTPEATPSPSATPTPGPVDPNKPATVADKKALEEEQKKLDAIAKENNIERPNESEINKKPLKDTLAKYKELKDKGQLDLSGSIEITMEADRDDEGKLHNATVESAKGDPKLKEVALDFASALSDSGVLKFLKDAKHLRMTLKLDENNVEINMITEVDSPQRAREMASGYNGLLLGGILTKKGQDEEAYYKATKVSSDGKQIIVNFSMPRAAVADKLTKYATPS